jgi:hypothetical protein
VFIILAGCGWFASAITEEKEDMTLGMLRMTNLNPLSILLGKSTSRLFGALMLLAAQFPFTILAITLGGVSLGQIGAAYCTLGAFLIFLANLALLASVISQRSSGAAGLTIALLILFFAIVPILSFLAHLPAHIGLITEDALWVTWLGEAAAFALLASPLTRFQEIFQTGFNDRVFGWQAASNLALGVLCFLVAWGTFNYFCDERSESAPVRANGPRKQSRITRPSRAWAHALAWKDFYFLTGGKAWVIGKFIIYALPIIGVIMVIWNGDEGRRLMAAGGTAMWISFLLFCIELAFAAASLFKTELQGQTLSTLATLPMSMEKIARQKVMGVLPALLPTVTYFSLGTLCVLPTLVREMRSTSDDHYFILGLVYLGSQAIFFLLLTANLSLRIKRGALPLAIAIEFILQFLLVAAFMVALRDEWAVVPIIMLTLFAVMFLYFDTLNRLERLAAEE